jgi:hypothetical protein
MTLSSAFSTFMGFKALLQKETFNQIMIDMDKGDYLGLLCLGGDDKALRIGQPFVSFWMKLLFVLQSGLSDDECRYWFAL